MRGLGMSLFSRVQSNRRWAGRLGLALIVCASSAMLIHGARDTTFFVDEWFVGFGTEPGYSADILLAPYEGNLLLAPHFAHEVLLDVFGATSSLPFVLFNTLLVQLLVVLVFVFVRRRVGYLAALPPAALIAFFGAGYDSLVFTHGFLVLMMLVPGVAFLLTLESDIRFRDPVCLLLLALSIATQAGGLAFAAGGAVYLCARRETRRLWVVLVPIALFGLWKLGYPSSGDDPQLGNLAGVPSYWLDSLAGGLSAVTGLFSPQESGVGYLVIPEVALDFGRPIAVAVVLAGLFAVAYRRRVFSVGVVTLIAVLLTFWTFPALVGGPTRTPLQSRYLLLDGVIILLVLAEIVRVLDLGRNGHLALMGVCVFGFIPNLKELHDAGAFFRQQSAQNKAVMGAASLVQGVAVPETQLESAELAVDGNRQEDMYFSLGRFALAAERYGSPAYSLEELRVAPFDALTAVDTFLVRALGIGSTPAGSPGRQTGTPIQVINRSGTEVRMDGACVTTLPESGESVLEVMSPPGGVVVRSDPGEPVPVGLRRFAPIPAAYIPSIPTGRNFRILIRRDAAPDPWYLQFQSGQSVTVCPPPQSGL